jgi:hypothetical protein
MRGARPWHSCGDRLYVPDFTAPRIYLAHRTNTLT